MSNDRGRRGGSRASIFSFIGLGLVGLFQKLGLSFSVVFFDHEDEDEDYYSSGEDMPKWVTTLQSLAVSAGTSGTCAAACHSRYFADPGSLSEL